MTEKDIHQLACGLMQALTSKNPQGVEVYAVDLLANFLVNQQRIADSLEQLACCVKPPNGYAKSEFEIRVYDAR